MNHPYLRSMTALEILTGAFRIYRDHLALLVMVALIPHMILLAVEYLVLLPGPMGPVQLSLLLAVTVILNALALAALTTALCGILLEEEIGLFRVYAITVRSHLSSVVVVYFLTALMVSAGFFMLIFPGLIVGGLFAPAVPIMIVEKRRAFASLARCMAIMKGEMAKGVVAFTFFILVAGVLPLSFLLMQASFGIGPFTPLLSAILGSVTLPLGFSAKVLLYFSLRAKEGYGVEQLAEELGATLPE